MMQTAETVLETFRTLPPDEKDKFFELAAAERAATKVGANGDNSKNASDMARMRLSMNWIRDHRKEKKYDGKWVCLDGEELVACGDDGVAVINEARAKGVEVPFIERMKSEELPFGGW